MIVLKMSVTNPFTNLVTNGFCLRNEIVRKQFIRNELGKGIRGFSQSEKSSVTNARYECGYESRYE